jgi:methyl-accepting chemotaxis protein
MVALTSVAMVMFQDTTGDQHKLTIYSLVIAVALVGQAVGVCAAAIFASRLLHKIVSATDSFEAKTTPLIAKATALFEDLTPKIHTITTNVEQTSYVVRAKVDELANTIEQLNRTVQDVNERSRVQVSRVDGIVTDALATTYEVSQVIQDNIKGPVRQIAGIIAGLKAGIETLVERSPFKIKRDPGPYDL